MPRVTCKITPDMDRLIDDLARELSLKRGARTMAYRELMQLANGQPEAAIMDFPGELKHTCVLEATAADLQFFVKYAQKAKTNSNGATFRDAIYRGLSIWVSKNSASKPNG